MRSLFLIAFGSVVAATDLDFHVIAFALDGDVAEGAVLFGVRRRIAGEVLGAEFLFDLLEGGFKLAAVGADVNETTASFL